MPATDEATKAVSTELHEEAGGRLTLILRGRLDSESTVACWRELEQRLRPIRVTALEIDAGQLTLEGAIGMALLRFLLEGGMTPGAPVTIRGLREEFQKILDSFTGEDFRAYRPQAAPKVGVLERIGRSVRARQRRPG